MRVVIIRDDQQFGPYTMAEVRQYLAEGKLLASDFAQEEGDDAWVPLSALPGLVPDKTSTDKVKSVPLQIGRGIYIGALICAGVLLYGLFMGIWGLMESKSSWRSWEFSVRTVAGITLDAPGNFARIDQLEALQNSDAYKYVEIYEAYRCSPKNVEIIVTHTKYKPGSGVDLAVAAKDTLNNITAANSSAGENLKVKDYSISDTKVDGIPAKRVSAKWEMQRKALNSKILFFKEEQNYWIVSITGAENDSKFELAVNKVLSSVKVTRTK
ncbi:MAG: DUF4339 domain-containing protein [Verrucomicrobiota bacterium]